MSLEFAHRPVQRLRPLELLQQHLHPETDGEEPFGNQLGRLGCSPDAPAGGTITTGAITVADMTVAHQTNLPFHLLTFLGQARCGPKLAADRAGALSRGQEVMGGLFGQMQTPLPFGAWAARLLPSAPFGLTRSPSRNRLRVRNGTLARSGCRARFRRSRQ